MRRGEEKEVRGGETKGVVGGVDGRIIKSMGK